MTNEPQGATMITRKDYITVIKENCGDMQIWIPTARLWNGKKLFRNTKDGRLAMRTGKNRMKVIQTPTVNAMTTILNSYQINPSTDQMSSDLFRARKKGRVR